MTVAKHAEHAECQNMLLDPRKSVACLCRRMGNTKSKPVHQRSGDREIFLRSLRDGDVTMTTLMSTTKSNVNACDDKGTTALHVSAMSGHIACVKYLLGRNADINKKDLYQLTPLHVAGGHGRTVVVDELFSSRRKLFCNERDIWGYTPLHRAVINYHFDTAEAMIRNGCLVNVPDENKRVPLHVSASYGHLETTQKLLDSGANIDWQDSRGRTPLYLAVVGKHEKVILELVQRGANVNLAHAVNHLTPLGLAAQKGLVRCVKILLQGGARCSLLRTSDNDVIPLESAIQKAGSKNGKKFKDFIQICEMLIEADGEAPQQNAFFLCYRSLRAGYTPEMLRILHLLFVSGVRPKVTLTMQTRVDPIIHQWSQEFLVGCLSLQDICSRLIRNHLGKLHGNVLCAANKLDTTEIPARVRDMLLLRHLYPTSIVKADSNDVAAENKEAV